MVRKVFTGKVSDLWSDVKVKVLTKPKPQEEEVGAMISRNNEQIWRLAEWLDEYCNNDYMSWNELDQDSRDWMYDKAAELLKKISLGEFTGQDNHND